jgi:hypothetical protein
LVVVRQLAHSFALWGRAGVQLCDSDVVRQHQNHRVVGNRVAFCGHEGGVIKESERPPVTDWVSTDGFTAIYRDCAERVYNFFLRHGCSTAEAEELTASTFVAAWRAREMTRDTGAIHGGELVEDATISYLQPDDPTRRNRRRWLLALVAAAAAVLAIGVMVPDNPARTRTGTDVTPYRNHAHLSTSRPPRRLHLCQRQQLQQSPEPAVQGSDLPRPVEADRRTGRSDHNPGLVWSEATGVLIEVYGLDLPADHVRRAAFDLE